MSQSVRTGLTSEEIKQDFQENLRCGLGRLERFATTYDHSVQTKPARILIDFGLFQGEENPRLSIARRIGPADSTASSAIIQAAEDGRGHRTVSMPERLS
jgi:hypothetical protein